MLGNEEFNLKLNLDLSLDSETGLDEAGRERLTEDVLSAFTEAAEKLRDEIEQLLESYGVLLEYSPLGFKPNDGPDTAAAVERWLSEANEGD